MRLLMTLAALAVAAVLSAPAAAGEPYNGHRPGYRYDYDQHEYRIIVADSVAVPIVVPSNLFINLDPPRSPPAVVFSQRALELERKKADDLAEKKWTARMKREREAMFAEFDRRCQKRQPVQELVSGRNLPPLPPGTPDLTDSPPATDVATDRPRADAAPQRDLVAVAGILKQRCAECHGGSKAKGGVSFFNDRGEFELKGATWQAIYASVKDDDMPKKPEKLTPAEKELFRVAAGSPN